MAKIKDSAMVPETKKLTEADPSGDDWVIIKPPGWEAEKRRGNLLSSRKYYRDDMGRLVTDVECNIRELWESEIWLTYGGSNLHVEFGDERPEIKFDPDGGEDYATFIDKLAQLPPSIVYEWRLKVLEVVPDWVNPF